MLRHLVIISLSLLTLCWHVSVGAKNSDQILKFTVVALSKDPGIRRDFENKLVKNLRANNYDAIASHTILTDLSDFREQSVYQKLRREGIQGVLLLRPIDVGAQASIKSARQSTWSTTYDSIEAFVTDYRGGDFSTQAVVQVSGFLISGEHSSNFWQGVIWLDDTVTTREEGIDKLSGLILSNLNASRAYLRKLLGLKPLTTD